MPAPKKTGKTAGVSTGTIFVTDTGSLTGPRTRATYLSSTGMKVGEARFSGTCNPHFVEGRAKLTCPKASTLDSDRVDSHVEEATIGDGLTPHSKFKVHYGKLRVDHAAAPLTVEHTSERWIDYIPFMVAFEKDSKKTIEEGRADVTLGNVPVGSTVTSDYGTVLAQCDVRGHITGAGVGVTGNVSGPSASVNGVFAVVNGNVTDHATLKGRVEAKVLGKVLDSDVSAMMVEVGELRGSAKVKAEERAGIGDITFMKKFVGGKAFELTSLDERDRGSDMTEREKYRSVLHREEAKKGFFDALYDSMRPDLPESSQHIAIVEGKHVVRTAADDETTPSIFREGQMTGKKQAPSVMIADRYEYRGIPGVEVVSQATILNSSTMLRFSGSDNKTIVSFKGDCDPSVQGGRAKLSCSKVSLIREHGGVDSQTRDVVAEEDGKASFYLGKESSLTVTGSVSASMKVEGGGRTTLEQGLYSGVTSDGIIVAKGGVYDSRLHARSAIIDRTYGATKVSVNTRAEVDHLGAQSSLISDDIAIAHAADDGARITGSRIRIGGNIGYMANDGEVPVSLRVTRDVGYDERMSQEDGLNAVQWYEQNPNGTYSWVSKTTSDLLPVPSPNPLDGILPQPLQKEETTFSLPLGDAGLNGVLSSSAVEEDIDPLASLFQARYGGGLDSSTSLSGDSLGVAGLTTGISGLQLSGTDELSAEPSFVSTAFSHLVGSGCAFQM